jgi:Rad3-related DNA helicase
VCFLFLLITPFVPSISKHPSVLVFLPSYLLLKKCVEEWNPIQQTSQHKSQSVWQRLRRSKGKVIVEQTGSQEAFEAAKVEYNETIRTQGSCILLAVYRGKMSEGVSFNDDFARCVICVGLPLPNWF